MKIKCKYTKDGKELEGTLIQFEDDYGYIINAQGNIEKIKTEFIKVRQVI